MCLPCWFLWQEEVKCPEVDSVNTTKESFNFNSDQTNWKEATEDSVVSYAKRKL